MADKKLSTIAGGGLPKLAPDLTYPSDKNLEAGLYKRVSLDASGGLTTIFSLTGKYLVSFLKGSLLPGGSTTVKLTVDGEVIWNDTFTLTGPNLNLLGGVNSSDLVPEAYGCESTYLLEIQTAASTTQDFDILARPII